MAEISGTIEYFPALKSRVGKWVYYLTSMPFSEVASRVKRWPRRLDNRRLHVLLQRELREDRLRQISHYLTTVEERFFNAVVIGIEGGIRSGFPWIYPTQAITDLYRLIDQYLKTS